MTHGSIGTLIKQINDALRQDANANLSQQNLTLAQAGLLRELSRKENAMATMKELEAQLSVSQPTVVGIVKRLEQKGYVESYESPEDRRIKIVRLTRTGKERCRFGQQYTKDSDARMLADIPPEQRDKLRDMLEKMLNSLKN